jgi:hypothetical protein
LIPSRAVRALPAVLVALLLWAAPAQAAPAWLPAADLTGALQGARPQMDVAVAPDGTAVAVWSQSGDGGPVVEAARRRPAQGWSAAIPVTAPGEQGRAPQVAIDAQDNATVVWVGARTGRCAPRGSRGAAAFEPADTLSNGTQPGPPAIAIGADGTAVVVFAEAANGSGRVLEAAIRPPGAAGFGDAVTISDSFRSFDDPTGDGPPADVGIDAAGGAVVAWAGFDGARFLVQTNERPAGGAFAGSGQTRSSTEGRASGTDPALAVDPAGGATVAWTHDADATDAGTRPRCAGASARRARVRRPGLGRRAGADRGPVARGRRRRHGGRRVGARQRRRPAGATGREAARAGVHRPARGLATRAVRAPRRATATGRAPRW